MCIVINKRASKSCKLWTSEVAEQQLSDLKYPSRTRERKAHGHPSRRTTRKSCFKTDHGISSRLVPSKVFSLFGFCALRRTGGESKILFAICNWKEAMHPLSENKQDWNQEKTFMIFYFCFFQIVQISKNKNYLNYDYYYPLTVNGHYYGRPS